MQIETVHDSVNVHVGAKFDAADVERLQQVFAALAPISELKIDFAGARQCDDAALARLAGTLMGFEHGAVTLHGLTVRQWRVLTYMGLEFDRV